MRFRSHKLRVLVPSAVARRFSRSRRPGLPPSGSSPSTRPTGSSSSRATHPRDHARPGDRPRSRRAAPRARRAARPPASCSPSRQLAGSTRSTCDRRRHADRHRPVHARAERHRVRVRLQPDGRPDPRGQRRRPEPAAQPGHGSHRRGRRHVDLRHRRRRERRRAAGHGLRVHEQRSRRDDHAALRPRLRSRRPGAPEPAEQRHARHRRPLGVDAQSGAGFDIAPSDGIAWASLRVPGQGGSQLYRINLTNGAATLVGRIGGGVALNGLAALGTAEPDTTAPTLALVKLATTTKAASLAGRLGLAAGSPATRPAPSPAGCCSVPAPSASQRRRRMSRARCRFASASRRPARQPSARAGRDVSPCARRRPMPRGTLQRRSLARSSLGASSFQRRGRWGRRRPTSQVASSSRHGARSAVAMAVRLRPDVDPARHDRGEARLAPRAERRRGARGQREGRRATARARQAPRP